MYNNTLYHVYINYAYRSLFSSSSHHIILYIIMGMIPDLKSGLDTILNCLQDILLFKLFIECL